MYAMCWNVQVSLYSEAASFFPQEWSKEAPLAMASGSKVCEEQGHQF